MLGIPLVILGTGPNLHRLACFIEVYSAPNFRMYELLTGGEFSETDLSNASKILDQVLIQ
jgi:hypothetical protein